MNSENVSTMKVLREYYDCCAALEAIGIYIEEIMADLNECEKEKMIEKQNAISKVHRQLGDIVLPGSFIEE